MKKILLPLLIAVLSLFVFTGCGDILNPEDGINELIQGTVYAQEDATPIPGIKVSSNYGYTFTDSEGKYIILSYYPVDPTNEDTIKQSKNTSEHKLTFTDVDGDSNGKFQSKTVTRKARTKGSMDVILDKDL